MKTQNRFAVALTIVLSLTAGALLLWQRPPLPADDNQAKRKVAAPHLTHAETAPETTTALAPTTAQRARVTAPPMPPNINQRCKNGFTHLRDSAGKFEGYSCHPSAYEDYGTEALESLAYGDAEAASVLAYRLRHTDYPRALRMAMRSAALSGGQTSTLTSATMWRPLLDQNGEPDLAGYGQAYVMYQLIEKLKNSSYRAPPAYENRIREVADDPAAHFERLDSIADRMFDEIRQIELDVTGNATIGGDDDV